MTTIETPAGVDPALAIAGLAAAGQLELPGAAAAPPAAPAAAVAPAKAPPGRKPKAPPAAARPKRRFEYLKEFVPDEADPPRGETRLSPPVGDSLNARGAEGWDIALMVADHRSVRPSPESGVRRQPGYTVFWKRELADE